MVIESILEAIRVLFFKLFSFINLPSLGDEFSEAYEYFESMLLTASSMIDLFIPWNLVKFGLPLVVAVMNFEHIYRFIMWILKKIPMLGIE